MRGIFLDIETTGLDFRRHAVVEIAFRLIDLFSGKEILRYESIVRQPEEVWKVRDLESIEVNGFNWELLCTGKESSQVTQELTALLEDSKIRRGESVFVCQNPSFDRSFFSQLIEVYRQEELLWPYHWLDFASMYWALQVKSGKDTRIEAGEPISLSKNKIAQGMGLAVEEIPHRAMNGVDHLVTCYAAVVGFPGQA